MVHSYHIVYDFIHYVIDITDIVGKKLIGKQPIGIGSQFFLQIFIHIVRIKYNRSIK